MKHFIASLAILLMVLSLTAQEKPSFITIQSGPSVPLGDYRLKSLDGGSFTLLGISASAEGTWFFHPKFGIGLYGGYHSHPVDVRALGYERVQADPSLEDLTIRSEPYKVFNLMAGAFMDWPLYRKLSLTAKLMAGGTFAMTPYQLYKQEFFIVGKVWGDISSAGDFEASFLAGTGVKYRHNDCLGFSLQGDFTYNAMEFDFNMPGGGTRTDYRKILFINISAGVVFYL